MTEKLKFAVEKAAKYVCENYARKPSVYLIVAKYNDNILQIFYSYYDAKKLIDTGYFRYAVYFSNNCCKTVNEESMLFRKIIDENCYKTYRTVPFLPHSLKDDKKIQKAVSKLSERDFEFLSSKSNNIPHKNKVKGYLEALVNHNILTEEDRDIIYTLFTQDKR